jgi:hypothetical protein
MNIFFVHKDPFIAAQSLVDRHVVKMILETAQLLSTAHRLHDGTEYIGQSKSGRKAKRWKLADEKMDEVIYQATHINHPSAVWCRQSNNNYNWLYWHFVGLIDEYHHRYGKVHKCNAMKTYLVNPPKNIPVGYLTQVTPAMDAKYIVSKDSVENYRNYYKFGKLHLHKYTKRQMPNWLTDTHENI